ncbi:MAG: DUF1990 family protein [Actinobacteria bacterium]|nr:DUF1990 family protein [Actinomycetota bacterium]
MSAANRTARARTVLGWPVGIAVVSWRYMWRTTPLHRSEETGTRDDLPDPDGEGSQAGDRRQPASAGVGPLMHRTYRVDITGTGMTPETLIDKVAAELNQATPEMAVFRKTSGSGHQPVGYGDEFVVRMPGPWDGPVRVIKREPAAFRLGTLAGHLEAGEIEFRAVCHDDTLRFEIESWARAGDRLSNLLYNKVRLAKEIQLNMWTHVCIRAAAIAGGRLRGGVTIRTRWVPWPS